MPENASIALGTTVKYNPHLWGKNELRAIFVARTRELAEIISGIRETAANHVPQHILITGARGMGKSTLLHRIALAVTDDAELSKHWLPLVMPEEQYTVATLTELWLKVLGVLADTLEQEGSDAQALSQLSLDVAQIQALAPAEQEAKALALLLDWIKQSGRRVLLLTDSTDQLFNSLSADQPKVANRATGSTQLWRLRNTLSHCPELFWLGASYQALEVTQQYNDAFHDFFELIELRPLTLEEMRTAMLALARTFGISGTGPGEAAAIEMQRNLDARPERLKTLRAITGGNPRTTVILYDLFAAGWRDDLHSDLKALLDTMTPLYKARMENLAEQPRKILAHIMEYWAPIALGELAQVSGIANTTLSGQLKRLELDGFIEKVKLPGTRRSGYQASERLFNIWYLMRNTSRWVRQKLTWLVEFMRLWYSADELRGLAQMRAEAHGLGRLQDGSHLELSLAYAAVLPNDCRERYQLEHSVFGRVHALAQQQKRVLNDIVPNLFDLDGSDHHFKTAEDYLQCFQTLDEKLARCPYAHTEAEKQAWISAIKQSVCLGLADKQLFAAVSETLTESQYHDLLKLHSDEVEEYKKVFGKELLERVLLVVAQGRFFPDCPDAELAYGQIISEFGDNAKIVEWCVDLFEAKYHDQWLEKNYQLWIKLDPNNATPWNKLGVLLSAHLRRYEEAEEAYRQAIALDPKYTQPWYNLGILLGDHLQRYEEAEVAYRQAIALDPKYALPWNGLGILLDDHLQRYEEAEVAYRQAIALDPKYAQPWNNLGILLEDPLQRYGEAEVAYRQAIALDPKNVRHWNNLGYLLHVHLQRYEEAEAAYLQAQQLDPEDPYPVVNQARLKAELGQNQTADGLYRQVVKLLQEKAGGASGIAYQDFLLQAHLWLNNQDAARMALEQLALAASNGNNKALFRLREQAGEIHALGLGLALSELMASSRYADFLQPMTLALRAAAGVPDALEGAVAEIKVMAAEVLAELLAYQKHRAA